MSSKSFYQNEAKGSLEFETGLDGRDDKDNDDDNPNIITLIHSDSVQESDLKPVSSSSSRNREGTNQGKDECLQRETNATKHRTAVALDLSNFAKADRKDIDIARNGDNLRHSSTEEAMNSSGIQERSVLVIFELPDGSQGEETFKYGHTVEYLKSFIEMEYGIPMDEQSLFLEDRKLQNPFSLLDYPEVKGSEEIFVRVEGNLPAFSKK